MPQPDRLLNTLQRAALAFRQTRGRRGKLIELQEVTEVLVAGDLHGEVDHFARLLRVANLAANPGRHLLVQELIHGHARHPNGTDRSHQLLDLLAALKCQFPERVHFLLGNHELSQLTGRAIGKGDESLNDLFEQGVYTAYGDWGKRIYTAYLHLLQAAPLAVRTPNRVFLSHSLPPRQYLATWSLAALEREDWSVSDLSLGGSIHALVWGRDTSPETAQEFLRKVEADWLITGHIHCPEGFDFPSPHQLILDAQGDPACYCLFPTDHPLTQAELLSGVGLL